TQAILFPGHQPAAAEGEFTSRLVLGLAEPGHQAARRVGVTGITDQRLAEAIVRQHRIATNAIKDIAEHIRVAAVFHQEPCAALAAVEKIDRRGNGWPLGWRHL